MTTVAKEKERKKLEIGEFVNKNRFATASQIEQVTGLSEATVYRYISEMCQEAEPLLRPIKPRELKTNRSKPWAYYATPAMTRRLETSIGFTDPWLLVRERSRKRGYSTQFLQHELNCTEFVVNLILSCQQTPGLRLLFYERDGRGDTSITARDLEDLD